MQFRKFSENVYSEKQKQFIGGLSGKRLAWLISLNCAEAGRWVAAPPKDNSSRFENKAFQRVKTVKI